MNVCECVCMCVCMCVSARTCVCVCALEYMYSVGNTLPVWPKLVFTVIINFAVANFGDPLPHIWDGTTIQVTIR